MGHNLVMSIFPIFLLLSIAYADFDVTSSKYGGKPNSDISQPLAKAWSDACASTSPSRIIVPKGTFQLKGASFKGPCKGPIEFQVDGTLQAPQDGAQLIKADTWIEFANLERLTLMGTGTFDGQGQKAWKENDCNKNPKCSSIAINLRFNSVKHSLVKDVTSLNSKNFHVNVLGCEQLTFQHFTVKAPGDSINTDGIHIGRSTGINITDTNIGTGDDCISIGDGTKQLTINKVTCGPGHGISIGSLGRYNNEDHVTGINVKDCTISNTMNGVRIKTWPNSPIATTASDIHFEHITMNNVGNPILIDQEYCPYGQCNTQTPSKVKISNVSFKNIRGTTTTAEAVKIVCAKGLPCDKVVLSDIDLKLTGKGTLTSQCANVQPTITQVPQALACATKK
ncbi:PREDICTED: exopolygalacturonase-like [Fragaria vesca subsp. vesca]|uniref:exopolygalacturonase-like n=1 Tax=Fragaria vesca subsp. vesca TaxID=101020 RepID=UPI0002C312A8|nr:PREDICTED: exopolygalacturonase-like [Fragaria vesca subsp. vesca]